MAARRWISPLSAAQNLGLLGTAELAHLRRFGSIHQVEAGTLVAASGSPVRHVQVVVGMAPDRRICRLWSRLGATATSACAHRNRRHPGRCLYADHKHKRRLGRAGFQLSVRDLRPWSHPRTVRCTDPVALHPIFVLWNVIAGFVVTFGLAGCVQSNTQAGGGMMDGGSGFHYSSLTCSAPSSLPGRVVRVTLADMGMTSMMGGAAPLGGHMMLRVASGSISAGTISLVASNMGWRTHELVILPLSAGGIAGRRSPGPDGKIDEAGSLGEASNSCEGGSGEGIRARTVGWTSVTLKPGRYELVCNLPNHYANGMRQELTVS